MRNLAKDFLFRVISDATGWPRWRWLGRLSEETAPVTLNSSTIRPARWPVGSPVLRASGSRRPAESAGRAVGRERRSAAGGGVADTWSTGPGRSGGRDRPGSTRAARGGVPCPPCFKRESDRPEQPGPRSPSRRRRPGCHAIHPSSRSQARGARPRRTRSGSRSRRSPGWNGTPRPRTRGEESVYPLNANSRTVEAGAERSGQASWPDRRPHRTVPPAGLMTWPMLP